MREWKELKCSKDCWLRPKPHKHWLKLSDGTEWNQFTKGSNLRPAVKTVAEEYRGLAVRE